MSQDFQMIGQVSPALERVQSERQGWPDDDPETLGHEIMDQADLSFRDRRANKQTIGTGELPGLPGQMTSMAAWSETPMAAMDPESLRADYPPVPEGF